MKCVVLFWLVSAGACLSLVVESTVAAPEKKPALLVLGAHVSGDSASSVLSGPRTKILMPDPKLETQLRDMGFEIGYGAFGPALNMAFLKQFNVVVLTEMPFAEQTPQYRDVLERNMQDLRAFVEAGGGLLLLRKPIWTFGQDIEAMNRMLAPWGASVPQEFVTDSRHEITLTRGWPLCWTGNIMPHPLTEGVKGLYYSPTYSFYHDYTSPVIVDESWIVLAKGMSSARSVLNPKGGERGKIEDTTGRFDSEPPLLAVREVGVGRVVLWPFSDTLIWQDAYHPGWGGGLAMDGNRDGRPGDASRLLLNLLDWLRAPSAGQLGGFVTPVASEETEVGFRQIDWDQRRPARVLSPHDYQGLIGARSRLTGGTDTPEAMIEAARAAGYDFLAFSEHLETLTAETFAALQKLCAAVSTPEFRAIPGYRYLDESGNTWVAFGQSLPYPQAAWLSQEHPGRLRVNNPLFRSGGTPPMILVHANRNPEAPWLQGNFKGFAVKTYENGEALDDSLEHYLELQRMRYRLFPAIVHFVDSVEGIRKAANRGLQTRVRWVDNDVEQAFRHRTVTVAPYWQSYASEGPVLETFQVLNFGMSDLAIPGNDRIRIHFRLRSPAGFAEIRLMDGPEIFRRFLPNGAVEFETTFDHFHDRQRNFVIVATDREGRRLISYEQRTLIQENRFQRCGDNYNTMPGGKHTTTPKGFDNMRGIEDYLFFRSLFPYTGHPFSPLFGNDTLRPAVKYVPTVASRFCTIVEMRLDEHYAPTAVRVVDRTDKPECAMPNENVRIVTRHTLFTPWADGPIVTHVSGEIEVLRDLSAAGRITLGELRGGGTGGSLFVAEQADDGCLVGDSAERTLSVLLPPHGMAALLPNPFRGASGIVALEEGLPIRARGDTLSADLAVTDPLTVGRKLPFSFIAVTGTIGGEPTNEFMLDVRRRFGFGGTPAWSLRPTRGEVLDTGFPAHLRADAHGFRANAPQATLPLPLPIRVEGLNPRWSAGVWYPGSHAFEIAEYRLSSQFHRYTERVRRRETDRLLHMAVLNDGTGLAQIDTTFGDKEVFIGNFVTCDRDEIFLTLADTRPGKAHCVAHNPTDETVSITIRPAPGFDLLGEFVEQATIPPGSSVTVNLPAQ